MNRAITSIITHQMKECFEIWKDAVAVHCTDDDNDDTVMGSKKDGALGTEVDSSDSGNRENIDTGDKVYNGYTGYMGKGRSPLKDMIPSTSSNSPHTVATYLLRTCAPSHPHPYPHPHITSMIDYTEERLTERVAAASMVQRDMLSLSSEAQRKDTQRSGSKSVEYSATLHKISTTIATQNQRYEIFIFTQFSSS